MEPTFDPREVDALVRRAAIAKRESAQARIAADEAETRFHEKYRAAASARDELYAYLEGAITRAAERLVDVGPMVGAMLNIGIGVDRYATEVVPGAVVAGGIHFTAPAPLSDADRALAAQAERDDSGGGACS